MKQNQRNKLSRLCIVIVALLTGACGAGVNNTSEELSGDSFFHESGLDFSYVMSHNASHRTIFPEVVAYAYDDKFIVVCQRPNKKHHRALLAGELNNGQKDFEYFLIQADSILSHDPYYIKIFSSTVNFWIIVNDTHEMIGPFYIHDYIRMREQLNISDDLKLNIQV